MSTMLERNVMTPEGMALDYHSVKWGRKVPPRPSVAYWLRCWVVEIVEQDGEPQFAILERRPHLRRLTLSYDYLRFSHYQFTDWSDPLRYLTAPPTQCLPNEYGISGRIAKMESGYFTFDAQPHRAPAYELTGRVLRSLLYIREADR